MGRYDGAERCPVIGKIMYPTRKAAKKHRNHLAANSRRATTSAAPGTANSSVSSCRCTAAPSVTTSTLATADPNRNGGIMRAVAAVVAALLGLATLTGCEPQQGGTPEPRPGAGEGQQQQQPAPEANQPGPQADPNQCNERGERAVELRADWTSKSDQTPKIMWMKNGETTPATNLESYKNGPGQLYGGSWSRLVTVKCGDRVAIAMERTRDQTYGACVIIDLGQDITDTGRSCRAEYTVP